MLQREGEPWFVLADVCRALNLTNPSMAAGRLDDDEKMTISNTEGHSGRRGGAQAFTIVSESGLYTIILRCQGAMTPGSVPHRFRKWVTGEVLPAIRKTGGYMVAAPEETPEQLALRAMAVLQATVDRQKAQLAEAQPKVEVHDRIIEADGSLTVTEAAKALQVAPKTLFTFLSRNGWIYKRPGAVRWLGYQTRTTNGDLEHKITAVRWSYGEPRVHEQVRVTPQGLAKLARLVPQGSR
ncbi:phage antirepressor KilAC domain-containing protein [Nitrospirillum iridis]|uniref:Prophage antirepressor-like protein n=1 Tax=Nitrospirillum iridis TaxID=765888 RepID=A0A7X0EG05_9PROT|nr:phage antirepressor KilAC domain-containing protein [Nitrospirillum iridis]MBB6253034.1 prophage antirepressor-like protein [Nitrospirillum iridis]